MTNKEVVLVQNLQMTYPLSAINNKERNKFKKSTLLSACVYQNMTLRRSEQLQRHSRGEFLFSVDEQRPVLISCLYIKGKIPLQILFHCQISAVCDVRCIPGVTLRWGDFVVGHPEPLSSTSAAVTSIPHFPLWVQRGGIVKHQSETAALYNLTPALDADH